MKPEVVVNRKKKAPAKKAPAKKAPEVKTADIEPDSEPEVTKGYIKAKEGRYVAKKTCTFGIGMYEEGSFYEAQEGELIPYHFEKA